MQHKFSYYFTHKGATDLLVYMTWGLSLVGLITGVFLRIPGLNSIAYGVVPALFVLTAITALPYLGKRVRGWDIVIYFSIVFVYAAQYVLFPVNSEQLDENITRFLFSSLPLFFVGLAIDFEKYEKPLYYISILCLAWFFFYSFSYKPQEFGRYSEDAEDITQYASMYLAYSVLPHVLYLIYYAFTRINIINVILAIAGAFLILSYGSRGPALCVFLYVAGLFLFFRKFKHPFWAWVIASLVVFVLYFYLEHIMFGLQLVLEEVGMRTRIIDQILASDLDSSGRDMIAQIIISKIREGGFFGYGICGSWQFVGTYPHNILLDILVSFGVLPGSLILLAIVVLIIQGYKGCKTDGEKAFWFLLLVRGFIMLFVSYNYLENGYLYMLLGYSVYLWRRKAKVAVMNNLSIQNKSLAIERKL